jgi:Family of unknown function (DUF6527)
VAWLTKARFLLDWMIGLLPGHEGRPSPVNLIPCAIHLSGREALPQLLNPRCLYLVGEPPKWAIFRCPCGTGHQIDLNLAHAGRPRWNVTFNPQNRPSLRPSVDVQDEERCHFWLTAGEVRWCQDSRRRLPTLVSLRPAHFLRDVRRRVTPETGGTRGQPLLVPQPLANRGHPHPESAAGVGCPIQPRVVDQSNRPP